MKGPNMIVGRQCEATMIGRNHAKYRQGDQCPEHAERVILGRFFCWVHGAAFEAGMFGAERLVPRVELRVVGRRA